MKLLPEKLSKVRALQGTLRSHVRSVLSGQWLRLNSWVLFHSHSHSVHIPLLPQVLLQEERHMRENNRSNILWVHWASMLNTSRVTNEKCTHHMLSCTYIYMYYHLKVLGYRSVYVILKILQYTPCLKT